MSKYAKMNHKIVMYSEHKHKYGSSIVSKWLGHSSTKVTEDNYLTELDEGYQLSLSKYI